MRLCEVCGGSGHLLDMRTGRVRFRECQQCDAFGTVTPAAPLVRDIVLTKRQNKWVKS